MSTSREIEALRKRLNRIVPIVSPPELKLHILGASDSAPKPSPWELVIRVEDKNPAFNS